MTIVGLQNVNYKSKKTGKDVRGYRFHMMDESDTRDDLIGASVNSEFVSEDVGRDFLRQFVKDEECIGHVVRVYYNRFGGVDEITSVQA